MRLGISFFVRPTLFKLYAFIDTVSSKHSGCASGLLNAVWYSSEGTEKKRKQERRDAGRFRGKERD